MEPLKHNDISAMCRKMLSDLFNINETDIPQVPFDHIIYNFADNSKLHKQNIEECRADWQLFIDGLKTIFQPELEDLKYQAMEARQTSERTVNELNYTIRGLREEIQRFKQKERDLKGQLDGKQYELDCETRKRKEAENQVHRTRFGY